MGCRSERTTCSPETTSSLTNILGWQPDMSYAPIRMIQIKSEEGKKGVRGERIEITVGGTERREITIALPFHQRLINLSLLELCCAELDAAGTSKTLSYPLHLISLLGLTFLCCCCLSSILLLPLFTYCSSSAFHSRSNLIRCHLISFSS